MLPASHITIFVAFVGCVDACVSCTAWLVCSECEMHLYAVLMDVRLHYPSDPLLTSVFLMWGWNMLVGKLSFRVVTIRSRTYAGCETPKQSWRGIQRTIVHLVCKHGKPGWWHCQRQSATCWNGKPFTCMWWQRIL